MFYIYKGWLTAVGGNGAKKDVKKTLFADTLQMVATAPMKWVVNLHVPYEHHSTPTSAPICFQSVNLQEGCVEEIEVAQTTTQPMFADQSIGRSDGQTTCPFRRKACQILLSQALSTFSTIFHASYMPAR